MLLRGVKFCAQGFREFFLVGIPRVPKNNIARTGGHRQKAALKDLAREVPYRVGTIGEPQAAPPQDAAPEKIMWFTIIQCSIICIHGIILCSVRYRCVTIRAMRIIICKEPEAAPLASAPAGPPQALGPSLFPELYFAICLVSSTVIASLKTKTPVEGKLLVRLCVPETDCKRAGPQALGPFDPGGHSGSRSTSKLDDFK